MHVGTGGSKNAGEAWGVMVGEGKSVGRATLLRTPALVQGV